MAAPYPYLPVARREVRDEVLRLMFKHGIPMVGDYPAELTPDGFDNWHESAVKMGEEVCVGRMRIGERRLICLIRKSWISGGVLLNSPQHLIDYIYRYKLIDVKKA